MASNSSFDVVSEYDKGEMNNVLDQVQREVGTRYDLKGTSTEIDWMNSEKEGFKIIDTNLGSGTIALACWDMKMNLDAFEINPERAILSPISNGEFTFNPAINLFLPVYLLPALSVKAYPLTLFVFSVVIIKSEVPTSLPGFTSA